MCSLHLIDPSNGEIIGWPDSSSTSQGDPGFLFCINFSQLRREKPVKIPVHQLADRAVPISIDK